MSIIYQIAHHFDSDYCAHLSLAEHVTIHHNYPTVWAEEYNQKNYKELDPVINNHQNGFIFWEDLIAQNLSQDQQQVMEFAQDFGIRSGLTFSLDTQVNSLHCFTLASLQKPEAFRSMMQKQFTKILAFVYVLQKNDKVTREIFSLTTAFNDYSQLSNCERSYQRQTFSMALTNLNIIESKTMHLCVPDELKSFFQSNYINLRHFILSWLEKLD